MDWHRITKLRVRVVRAVKDFLWHTKTILPTKEDRHSIYWCNIQHMNLMIHMLHEIIITQINQKNCINIFLSRTTDEQPEPLIISYKTYNFSYNLLFILWLVSSWSIFLFFFHLIHLQKKSFQLCLLKKS